MLVILFSITITIITKQSIKLIRTGTEDERIKRDHSIACQKFKNRLQYILGRIISIVFCVALILSFLISIVSSFTENGLSPLPSLRVVKSGSMSKREEKNQYLFDNELHNQIQIFDLIVTHAMPNEDELELYDIVVYQTNGEYIIHRIIGIEEPNNNHPSERHFLLQGDAVRFADKFPVKYEQMVGIYRGERIAKIGSFVAFMQSPAGYLCFLLAIFCTFIIPVIEKRIIKEELRRIEIMFDKRAASRFGKRNLKSYKSK